MIFLFMLPLVLMTGVWAGLTTVTDLNDTTILIMTLTFGVLASIISTVSAVHTATQPLETVQKMLLFTANNSLQAEAPDLEQSKLGKELLEAINRQIYALASPSPTTLQPVTAVEPGSTTTTSAEPGVVAAPQLSDTVQSNVVDELPVPVIGTSNKQIITVANKSALAYFDDPAMVGKNIDDVLKLSFQSDTGLEQWLEKSRVSSVTAHTAWERVRHVINEDSFKQFDLAASFSSGSSSGTEVLLAIYDKTELYGVDDQELNLVALAVHELRTPLTIMRGYVEVFQDELGPTLTPELKDFMHKMQASTQQLTAFVGNILNVARVQENQLSLTLREGDWKDILQNAIEDLQLRARVHGIDLQLSVPDDLPTVGVDKISAHEIVNNLVDNAIKYSNGTDKIIVSTKLNDEGLVETSVQDFGIGIPTAVMGTLFQKYHRSHKSSTQVGGTGLGLYLCKALVAAHGGNIWVRSKEGEGSLFSFTLLPYSQLSAEQIAGEDGIVRGAHGWIKNHSLYRN